MSSSPVSWKCESLAGVMSATSARAASSSLSYSGGCSGSRPSSPSRRSTGGWPTLRWVSLAPSSTARLSTAFRSTRRLFGSGPPRLEPPCVGLAHVGVAWAGSPRRRSLPALPRPRGPGLRPDRRHLGARRREPAADEGGLRQGALPARPGRTELHAALRADRGDDRRADHRRRHRRDPDLSDDRGRAARDAGPAQPALRPPAVDVAAVLHRNAHRRALVAATERRRRRAERGHEYRL